MTHYEECRALDTGDPADCTCRAIEADARDAELERRVDYERERGE